MEYKSVFAERLRILMNEKELSISGLAQKTGIPRTSINSWFLKTQTPSSEYAIKIAKFFNCSLDYLYGLKEE